MLLSMTFGTHSPTLANSMNQRSDDFSVMMWSENHDKHNKFKCSNNNGYKLPQKEDAMTIRYGKNLNFIILVDKTLGSNQTNQF